jgi:hypothetical protein
MKYLKLIAGLFICVFILTLAFGKQSVEILPSGTIAVSVSNCVSKKINIQNITVCLDSVYDSRGPLGAECFWAGEAHCRFKATFNNHTYGFNLGTMDAIHKKDTTINGYKFTLDSLTPYPSVNSPHPYTDYKAYITISHS